MKKIMVMLLVAALLCCGCGGSGETAVAEGIILESSGFTNRICPADCELIISTSPELRNFIYAELVLFVCRKNGPDLGSDNISGKAVYQDKEYELHYCREGAGSGSIQTDPLKAGTPGRIHLYAAVPTEAAQGKVEVSYVIDGTTYQATVEGMQAEKTMENKTELKTGSKVETKEGVYQIEVLEWNKGDSITASVDGSYEIPRPHPTVFVRLRITNHSSQPLANLFAYSGSGENVNAMAVMKETDNNTAVSSNDGIEPGATETLLLYIDAENVKDGMIRVNLGGNCYYIKTN